MAPFLKNAFAIEQMRFSKNVGCGLLPMGRQQLVDGLQVVPAAAVNRTDERLGGIGRQRCSGRFIPQSFGSKYQKRLELKFLSQLCEPAVTYELGPQA